MIKPEVESGKELKLHQMEKPRGLWFQVRIHLHLKSYVFFFFLWNCILFSKISSPFNIEQNTTN